MRAVFLAVTLALAASSLSAQDTTHAVKAAKVKRQTNLISEEEIAAIRTEAADAYAVVSRLRPQYLRLRGGGQPVGRAEPLEIKVVVDNAGRGGIDVLRQIPVNTIKEIRYLNGTDASIQYGTNYGGGAILVFTK